MAAIIRSAFACLVVILGMPVGVMAEQVAGLSPPKAVGAEKSVSGTTRIRIKTEMGTMLVELYPDKAPNTVADLIDLVQSGYYSTDTVMESRADLGFVIAKVGSSRVFEAADDAGDGVSRRGSVAITRSSVTNAYLNNIFFGYNPQPELEKQYVIIGQVIEGLDQQERATPAVIYKVDGFSVVE